MSLSSKARKERTDSYASQRGDNVQGMPPGLSELSERDLSGDLMSQRVSSSSYDVTDVQPVDTEPNDETAESTTAKTEPYGNEVEVSDAKVARDEDPSLYSSELADDNVSRRDMPKAADDKVPGADWNRNTDDEPVRELGHS